MSKVHELLGIAVEQQGLTQALLETEQEAHRKTVGVLADIKAGRISLDRLEVEGHGWTVKPPVKCQVIGETTINVPANRLSEVLNGELVNGEYQCRRQ